MSVHIEREPAVEPIRKITISCATRRRDTLTLYFAPDGSAEAMIELDDDEITTSVDISSEDLDTILQAFAEIRRDIATSPF